MRAFIAGANGFLGAEVTRALVDAGHEVAGLVRSEAKGERVRAAGGEPVVGDLTDLPTFVDAAADADVLVHLAQPRGGDAEGPEAPVLRERVRVGGCRNLVEAARRHDVPRLVVGSGYWVYGGRHDLIHDDDPVNAAGSSLDNLHSEEVARDAAREHGLEVTVVRPGMVYGPGSWFQGFVQGILEGTYQLVGDGSNRWSPVHLEDAGEAYRVILEAHQGGNYLVVDDEPAPVAELARFVADQLNVEPPGSVSIAEAAREMGEAEARNVAMDQPCSNAKLRKLGWEPAYPTYRDGVPGVLWEMGYDVE